jgi:spermidine/putrescine transport system ATP-binding protein
VPPEKRNVHTVFQSYALFPHMTVAQNIGFPLKMAQIDEGEIARRVDEALEDVSLTGMSARYPNELSGGQRQRVAVARALINRPKLLLLDEPLAALDAKLKERMQLELITLQKEVGIAFVYVTHDQQEALALAHRIAVMNHGRVEQLDEPSKIYSYPKNRFVADFIGTCNILDAEVLTVSGETMQLKIAGLGEIRALRADSLQPGQRGALALRPEQVAISPRLEADPQHNHFFRPGVRFPLPRRRDGLCRRVAEWQPRRSDAAQFRSGPGEVLRGRRSGRNQLALRRRPLPGGLTCESARSASGSSARPRCSIWSSSSPSRRSSWW